MAEVVTAKALDDAVALLRVLADPKQAQAVLKQLADLQADLDARHTAFKRDKEAHARDIALLGPQREAVAAGQAVLVAAQADHARRLEAHESEWQTRNGSLSDRKRDLDKREMELTARHRQVAKLADEAAKRAAEAESRHTAAQQREAAVAAREAALADKNEQLKALIG